MEREERMKVAPCTISGCMGMVMVVVVGWGDPELLFVHGLLLRVAKTLIWMPQHVGETHT